MQHSWLGDSVLLARMKYGSLFLNVFFCQSSINIEKKVSGRNPIMTKYADRNTEKKSFSHWFVFIYCFAHNLKHGMERDYLNQILSYAETYRFRDVCGALVIGLRKHWSQCVESLDKIEPKHTCTWHELMNQENSRSNILAFVHSRMFS